MKKEVKDKIKDNLLCVLKDLEENADSIVKNSGELCTSVKIVIRDLGVNDIPNWKVSYTHVSKNYINKNKKD